MSTVEIIEQRITELIIMMESKELTEIGLDFTSGWRFKLKHPKATKQLNSNQKITYPREKNFKEEYLALQNNNSVKQEKQN